MTLIALLSGSYAVWRGAGRGVSFVAAVRRFDNPAVRLVWITSRIECWR